MVETPRVAVNEPIFHRWGLAEIERLFALWHGQENLGGKAAGPCRELGKCWAALWTFGRVDSSPRARPTACPGKLSTMLPRPGAERLPIALSLVSGAGSAWRGPGTRAA